LDTELLPGLAVVAPATTRSGDAQVAIGAAGAIHDVGAGLGALGRGNVGPNRQCDRRIGRKFLDRPDCDPPFGQRICCQVRNDGVFVYLVAGGQPDCGVGAIDAQIDGAEHGFGVHALVEADEEDRVEWQRVVHGRDIGDLRCRSRELEAKALGKFCTGGRHGASRDFDDILGGGRDAVDRSGLVFEPHGTSAKPDPASGHLRRNGNRDVGGFDLTHRRKGNHWLIERHRDERGEIDWALGLETQHLRWCCPVVDGAECRAGD